MPATDRVTSSTSWRSTLRPVFRSVILPVVILWVIGAFLVTSVLHSSDLTEYARYAHAALRAPLFHRLPLEYPAPALAIFLLPFLLPLAYPWAFAVVVGIVLVALTLSYVGLDGSELKLDDARTLIAYLALGAAMFLTGRYDLFAAAAAFWAIRSARSDHWAAAWTWSSIGFVLKLFPAVLWPVLFLAEWRRSGRAPWRRVGWVAAAAFVLVGVPAILDRSAALNAFRFYARRPPEIGSVSSGLSLILDWPHWSFSNGFHSVDAVSPLVGPLAAALLGTAILGLVAVWGAQLRGRLVLEDAALASMTLVVLGTKVFSTQYLVWLIPFWALYRVRWSWVAACVVNTAVFPFVISDTRSGFLGAHDLAASMTLMSFARDVLIAVGTGLWLREVLALRRTEVALPNKRPASGAPVSDTVQSTAGPHGLD